MKALNGKLGLVVAGCPVMALSGAHAICDSTIFVHLREGNSAGLGCPTGGSMAPMGLEHEGHTEPLCSAGCRAPSLPGCAPCREWVLLSSHGAPGFFPTPSIAHTVYPAWGFCSCFQPGRTLALACFGMSKMSM